MMTPTATTTTGKIEGISSGGVRIFYGVPYASPPVGDHRFARPTPHDAWTGVRDCTRPGPTAPQFTRLFPQLDIAPLVGGGWQQGDDFLTTNIWAPESRGTRIPVMVFIHGGAFGLGSSYATVTDGSAFARSGVICFSIHYRLGVEGFLPAAGIPANLGLRDILFALQWVKENAEAFGGDPENITVFGESAGAMAIGDLLGSPLSKGLFQRAILQSGHASMCREQQVAARVVQFLADFLKIEPNAAGFRSRSIAECVSAFENLTQPTTRIDLRDANEMDSFFGMARLSPVLGDDVLPQKPLMAVANGAGKEVDVLIGTNREEMNLYFVPIGVRQTLTAPVAVAMLSASLPKAAEVLAAYGLGDSSLTAGEVFCTAMHDLTFRAPARQLAAAHQGRTHVYELGWRSPACEGQLGACHGLELPFVFNTLSSCTGSNGIAGENPPQELADSTHALWVAFAKDGSLPWPEFNANARHVYSLETGTSAIEAPSIAEKYLL
jgi:para-nitrobenzyl esterase